jgi:hypothetical protein
MAAPQKDMTSKTVEIDPTRNSGSLPGRLCSTEKRIRAAISNRLHNPMNHTKEIFRDLKCLRLRKAKR